MSDPIVCLSGAGNISQSNFDLVEGCGAPADQPVYVVLRVRSAQPDLISTPAVTTLTEGSQSCSITAGSGESADCAVTVQDGELDQLQASGSPENYALMVSWASSAAEIVAGDSYTYTLESGKQLDVYTTINFGEIIASGLLLSLITVLVLKFCYRVVFE